MLPGSIRIAQAFEVSMGTCISSGRHSDMPQVRGLWLKIEFLIVCMPVCLHVESRDQACLEVLAYAVCSDSTLQLPAEKEEGIKVYGFGVAGSVSCLMCILRTDL